MQKRYLSVVALVFGSALLGWTLFRSSTSMNAPAEYVLRINDARYTRLELRALHEAMAREKNSRNGSDALEALIEHELLYQEALKRGLDRSDPVIRRRLVQLVLEQNEAAVPLPDDASLARFYQRNITRYTRPATVQFDQWFLPHGSDPAMEKRLQQQPRNLTPAAFASVRETLRLQLAAHSPERPYSTDDLRKLYGTTFAEVLPTLPTTTVTMLRSDIGMHWVLPYASQATEVPALQDIRDRVHWEWREVERIRLNRALLEQLHQQADIDIRLPQ